MLAWRKALLRVFECAVMLQMSTQRPAHHLTGTAEKFAPVGEQSSEQSSEDTSSEGSTGSDDEGSESAE